RSDRPSRTFWGDAGFYHVEQRDIGLPFEYGLSCRSDDLCGLSRGYSRNPAQWPSSRSNNGINDWFCGDDVSRYGAGLEQPSATQSIFIFITNDFNFMSELRFTRNTDGTTGDGV